MTSVTVLATRVWAFAIAACAIGALLIHVIAWLAALVGLWQDAVPHVPRIQSAIVLGAGLLAVRAAASDRRRVRQVVLPNGQRLVAGGGESPIIPPTPVQ